VTMTTKVLLLYASFGDGHKQAATALADAFARRNVDVQAVDCFRATSRISATVTEKLYEQLTAIWPALYGASYNWTKSFGPRHILWRCLAVFSRKAAHQAVNTYRPNAVLQLFPDHALATWPRSDCLFIGTVLTDYAVHGRWFHPRVDSYYIPHAALYEAVYPFVYSGQRILDTGVPIRQIADEKVLQMPTSRAYIVISTGGRGVFQDIGAVVRLLRRFAPDRDIVVLCGRNEAMQRRVADDFAGDERVRGLGFVDNMSAWLQYADFAVVKAGGLTVAECLIAACPMVFYRPLPGQEAKNASFITTHGAALLCDSANALAESLVGLSARALEEMRTAAVRLQKTNAAERIVDDVLSQLGV